MKIVKDNKSFLQAVADLNVKQSKALLLKADKTQLRCISEIAHNIIAGVIQLSTKDKTLLNKFKWAIRKIAGDRKTLKFRHTVILAKMKAVKAIIRVVLQKLD